jgi:hypothetical protein
MQLLHRNYPLIRAILAALVCVASVCSSQVFAQSAPQLSTPLSNAVHDLANKIAAAAGNTQPLSLEVKNVSSLSPSDAGAARQALEADLTQRHFRLVSLASAPASDAAMQVRVTFSEGVEGWVWVAEIGPANGLGNKPQVAIVAVAKPSNNISRDAQDSLTLDKRLVWEQQDKFADFAMLPQSVGASSTLLILEPGRLASYRSSNGQVGTQWQPWQSLMIAYQSSGSREVVGRIDIASQKVSLQGVECAGDLQQPQSLRCGPVTRTLGERKMEIPGREGAEAVQLAAKCGEGNVLLATGTGDWTQPDLIQGFESVNTLGQPIASGDPIAIDGPVISFSPSSNGNDARAVVYNLKTSHYEGYVVTATCNH